MMGANDYMVVEVGGQGCIKAHGPEGYNPVQSAQLLDYFGVRACCQQRYHYSNEVVFYTQVVT